MACRGLMPKFHRVISARTALLQDSNKVRGLEPHSAPAVCLGLTPGLCHIYTQAMIWLFGLWAEGFILQSSYLHTMLCVGSEGPLTSRGGCYYTDLALQRARQTRRSKTTWKV